jgi:Transglutaminase-like superfamily
MNFKAAYPAFKKVLSVFTPHRRARIFYAFVLVLVAVGAFYAVKQYREQRYVNQFARNVSAQAGSRDTMGTVVALRDYLRQNVRRDSFPARGRPFLRNTAAETLASGKGRCGESTRAFVNMAAGLGIQARRLYLEGRRRHVVALVTLEDGRQVIVDSADRPFFFDIEPLDQLSQHPEFNYHSSFNAQRMLVALPSNTINLGPLSYVFENPHAIAALLFVGLAFFSVALRSLRHPVRSWRKRRATVARAAKEWHAAPAGSASA